MNPAELCERTLALARRGIGLTEPNPRVGCVLVAPDGRTVLGEGHTQQAGGPHAEVVAMRAAAEAGHALHGATAWVTLEPCAHHGRTPPCCDALVRAGIVRVVVALRDPFDQVDGRGLQRLLEAGVQVQLAGAFSGDFARDFAAGHPADPQGLQWAEAARELNIGFLSRVVRGRPWVRIKIAASLDGQTALANGQSQWITGEAARADGHAWRRRAGAVLTGIGTVRDDDPRLDVRLVPTALQPLRVVVDSRAEIPPGARILQPPGAVLVYANPAAAAGAPARAVEATHPHAHFVPVAADERGKTDLATVLADLARRGVNELHVEAGHQLNGSLLRAGLVDELLVYLAPRLLGPGRGMAAFGPLERLADALQFGFVDCDMVGADLRLRARPPGRAGFGELKPPAAPA
jgi:diaminohydroxyphosphoribosylaminopyrimidine deaminase/5-amino-6-(5-phosphoribosylamino)uracil reductase